MSIITDVLRTKQINDLLDFKPSRSGSCDEPEITHAKVEKAIRLLRNIEDSGGLENIAVETGLSLNQVKDIRFAMIVRINELRRRDVISSNLR